MAIRCCRSGGRIVSQLVKGRGFAALRLFLALCGRVLFVVPFAVPFGVRRAVWLAAGSKLRSVLRLDLFKFNARRMHSRTKRE